MWILCLFLHLSLSLSLSLIHTNKYWYKCSLVFCFIFDPLAGPQQLFKCLNKRHEFIIYSSSTAHQFTVEISLGFLHSNPTSRGITNYYVRTVAQWFTCLLSYWDCCENNLLILWLPTRHKSSCSAAKYHEWDGVITFALTPLHFYNRDWSLGDWAPFSVYTGVQVYAKGLIRQVKWQVFF